VGSDPPQDFLLWDIRPRWQIETPQNLTKKSFESLLFSLKGHFLKIICMFKLQYPRHSPLSKIFFCVPWGLIPRRTSLKFKYLREFEPEFETVLRYELGAHKGSTHEKYQGPKISCYCTFKGSVL
jgi:hypothetical protein